MTNEYAMNVFCPGFFLQLIKFLVMLKDAVIIGGAVVAAYPASYPVRLGGALLECTLVSDKKYKYMGVFRKLNASIFLI